MNKIQITMPKSVETAFLAKTTNVKKDNINSGINDIWRGYVVTSDNQMVKSYIKKIRNTNELYREIFCSLLGRALGIDTPDPMIVKVEANHPDIPSDKDEYLFGTKDCDSISFSRFLHENKLNEDYILNYDDFYKIIAFDEFIANPDRHFGNVLFNGSDFTFIDHGEAFHHSVLYNTPLTECTTGENAIAKIFKINHGHNDITTQNLIRKINKFIKSKISEEQIKLLPSACKLEHDTLNLKHQNIHNFLLKRLPLLSSLVGFSVKVADNNGQLYLK